MKKIILLFTLLGLTLPALALTNYVSDDLVITMRTGKGNSYQILRTLHSGERLEVLSVDGEYTQVKTKDGIEGWVRSQYLSREPIARDKLARAEKRLETLQTQNRQLQAKIDELGQSQGSLDSQLGSVNSENRKLKEELEKLRKLAARPMELAEQNDSMKKRLLDLEMESQLLSEKNASLKDRSQRDWFIAGAGVLIAGILLGLLLPKLRRQHSRWGDL